jgi:hypothetical protein
VTIRRFLRTALLPLTARGNGVAAGRVSLVSACPLAYRRGFDPGIAPGAPWANPDVTDPSILEVIDVASSVVSR